jgi:hypothetical protein
MIHPSGTFEYEAEFTSDTFGEWHAVLRGRARKGTKDKRLVGLSPDVKFGNDRLVLVASERSNSSVRSASFAVGDAIPVAAQPGDKLHVVRTGRGGIGLSLLREDRLVVATGAVTAVPLGTNITVIQGPHGLYGFEELRGKEWIELQLGSEKLVLRERGVTTIGDYEVYFEHGWEFGYPGIDECASICGATDPDVKLACIRSAALLGYGDMQLNHWDGEGTS